MHNTSLVQFEGRRAPVAFDGVENYTELQLSGYVSGNGQRLERRSNWPEWDRVARMDAPVCYRDHLGRRLFVAVDLSYHHSLDPLVQIQATLTEVDYAEE
jgi:hypothetical protein